MEKNITAVIIQRYLEQSHEQCILWNQKRVKVLSTEKKIRIVKIKQKKGIENPQIKMPRKILFTINAAKFTASSTARFLSIIFQFFQYIHGVLKMQLENTFLTFISSHDRSKQWAMRTLSKNVKGKHLFLSVFSIFVPKPPQPPETPTEKNVSGS